MNNMDKLDESINQLKADLELKSQEYKNNADLPAANPAEQTYDVTIDDSTYAKSKTSERIIGVIKI